MRANKTHRILSFAAFAALLSAALLAPACWAQEAVSPSQGLTILLLPVINEAGESRYFLTEMVSRALQEELARTAGAYVAEAEGETEVAPGAWVLRTEITAACWQAHPDLATVELFCQMAPAPEGWDIRLLKAKGKAGRDEGSAISYRQVMEQAAWVAAHELAQELVVTLRARGNVFSLSPKGREILVTLGSDQGLRRTAQLHVLREGKRIGTAEAIRVGRAESTARLLDLAGEEKVQLGDMVVIACNGPSQIAAEDAARAKHITRSNAGAAAIILGLFVGLVSP